MERDEEVLKLSRRKQQLSNAPKPWPKTMLALPPKCRRIINNFMSTRLPDGDTLQVTDWQNYEYNTANWRADMRSYGCPDSMYDYMIMRNRYIRCGPITTIMHPLELNKVGTASHHPDCICNACRGSVRPPE